MSIGHLISIGPDIPSTCLNSFAGELLKRAMFCERSLQNGIEYVGLSMRTTQDIRIEVDQDFAAIFNSVDNDDPLKACLLETNPALFGRDIEVGQKMDIDEVYVEDFVQRIVCENPDTQRLGDVHGRSAPPFMVVLLSRCSRLARRASPWQ